MLRRSLKLVINAFCGSTMDYLRDRIDIKAAVKSDKEETTRKLQNDSIFTGYKINGNSDCIALTN